MILYFSGTGNSKYVAKRIGKAVNDEAIDLFDKIRNNDISELKSERSWVIVVSTYSWRIPHIVQKWIENTTLTGNRAIYFVMTCAGSIGNAGKYLEKLCARKKMDYYGCAEIVMPENYIALFSAPTEERAIQIIGQAESVIDNAVNHIKKSDKFPLTEISLGDRLKSGILNDLFFPLFVHAKKFYATDDCISCGKCVNFCPLNNVRMENGRPVWAKNCTHCMACICRCPKEAIEYGKHTHGLTRYICKKEV